MELTGYIAQLLQEHDCVIVPHFGGFIANYQSAAIDSHAKKISPPSKSVLFNSNLIHNDGLLGYSIVSDQAISYPSALDFISSEVKKWQSDLAKGKRIEIGELGFLFRSNNQLVFEQSREVNILLSAYGLTEISFVNFQEVAPKKVEIIEKIEPVLDRSKEAVIIALQPEQSIETIAESDEVDEQIIPIQSNRNRKILKYMGVAAVIPILFYTYWIPMETDFIDTGKIQFSDFNPIHRAPERQYQMRLETATYPTIETQETWEELTENLSENVTVYNYHFDDQLYIPIRLDKTATVVEETIEQKNSTQKTINTGGEYHVIGGCFSVKENAENLVADLKSKGYQASIFDFKGGLYRVSAGDYSNSIEAEAKLDAFKSSGFSGWILKK